MDVEHLRWERWKEGRTGGREEEEEETEQATSASARSTGVPGLIQASQGWAGLRTPALPVSGGRPWRGATLTWIWPQDWGEGWVQKPPSAVLPALESW